MIEAKHAKGRRDYQSLVYAMRKLVEWGDMERVRSVKEQLIVSYPKRKALLEELQVFE